MYDGFIASISHNAIVANIALGWDSLPKNVEIQVITITGGGVYANHVPSIELHKFHNPSIDKSRHENPEVLNFALIFVSYGPELSCAAFLTLPDVS